MHANWKNIQSGDTVRFTMVFNGVKASFENWNGKRWMKLFHSVSEARDWVRSDKAWKVVV